MRRTQQAVSVLIAALAAGCDAQRLYVGVVPVPDDPHIGDQADASPGTFTPMRSADILFVIDDSSSTLQMQQNLIRNVPAFMTGLMAPPGLPSLHVAVVSTDLGAGDGSLGGCDSTGGKQGVFQYAARGACTASSLDPGATFISDVAGVRNYRGSLEDVFSCIAPLGQSGCGFEHQLAAITRALGADGRPPPAENEGFLRPDAFLVIIVVTDEDDCSAAPGSPLFDTTGTSLDSPLGPAVSFRCNEFGHLCGGARPPRRPPSGNASEVVTLDGCTAAEHEGMLIPVRLIAEQVRSLKRHPDRQVLVAAITGPKAPYAVQWSSSGPTGATTPRPRVAPSCTGADGIAAAPAVRIHQWVEAFGLNGLVLPICADDYAPSLDRLVQLMHGVLAPSPD
jgi:hypothetical protein